MPQILSVDAQTSLNGGVVVHATGFLTLKGAVSPRPFAQVFFLAQQEIGYYVLNDLFCWLQREEAAEAPEPSPHQDPDLAKRELNARLKRLTTSNPVVLFMKGSPDEPRCGFSKKAVKLLQDAGAEFGHFDILTDQEVRQGLKEYSNWPTYPQLYVNGERLHLKGVNWYGSEGRTGAPATTRRRRPRLRPRRRAGTRAGRLRAVRAPHAAPAGHVLPRTGGLPRRLGPRRLPFFTLPLWCRAGKSLFPIPSLPYATLFISPYNISLGITPHISYT